MRYNFADLIIIISIAIVIIVIVTVVIIIIIITDLYSAFRSEDTEALGAAQED